MKEREPEPKEEGRSGAVLEMIQAFEQGRKEIVVELGTLANEGGSGPLEPYPLTPTVTHQNLK